MAVVTAWPAGHGSLSRSILSTGVFKCFLGFGGFFVFVGFLVKFFSSLKCSRLLGR